MTIEVALEVRGGEARAARLESGRLVEVGFAEDDDPLDRIALGRVVRVDPDLDAAFVDLGAALPGYLDGARAAGVHEGQAVIVQVTRAPTPGKGPRLSTDIALIGNHLILRPGRKGVTLSARLARTPDRKTLLARARRLFLESGVVLRTAAAGATDDDLLREANDLRSNWRQIGDRAASASAPVWVDARDPSALRVLAGWLRPAPDRILVGEPATLARVRLWLERTAPELVPRLERQVDPFEATGAADQLQAALEPEVPLRGGGRLIIEPTAALVAIDVDGGARRSLDVDLEAADEIARQVRLRALGGTIVIDFVDLAEASARQRVDRALRRAFEADPEPVRIWPMGPQGLVQISRRRRGPSLQERLTRPCRTCQGSGRESGLE